MELEDEDAGAAEKKALAWTLAERGLRAAPFGASLDAAWIDREKFLALFLELSPEDPRLVGDWRDAVYHSLSDLADEAPLRIPALLESCGAGLSADQLESVLWSLTSAEPPPSVFRAAHAAARAIRAQVPPLSEFED